MNDKFKELADLILPNVKHDIAYYENLYPKRDLPEGAIVSRFAPSPTGFVHMGSLFAAFVEKKAAKDTGGVFYLRIEDTDQKREVENGISGIVKDFEDFSFSIDEGMTGEDTEKGNYGPYIQSRRKEIYETFVKHLLLQGLAYPCFCSPEELEEQRRRQEKNKERIGYYGDDAVYRNYPINDAIERVKNGDNFVVRMKSPGNFNRKCILKDVVKGTIEFPENDMDIVILKSDGLPTYHFAHLVDDHLMRTTHVIRGDEWLSSAPIHIQLFQMFGFELPKFAHLSPIMKQDGDSKRKLSKRKDPEAAVNYYHEKGIPVDAVYLYLMTVANSNFELWYEQNRDKSIDDFKFDFKKMSSSGGLFDLEKLMNISKNYISRLTAEDVYNQAIIYAEKYDSELYELLTKYKDYSIAIFNIEREQKKPRKDYGCYSDLKEQIWYMYDELYNNRDKEYEFSTITDRNEISNILTTYINKYYDEADDKEIWFNRMKEMAVELGYAGDMKDYKENPDNYKGNIADVSMVLRVALTSKSMTPDLYEIMKLLGKEKMTERYKAFIS